MVLNTYSRNKRRKTEKNQEGGLKVIPRLDTMFRRPQNTGMVARTSRAFRYPVTRPRAAESLLLSVK